MLTGEEKYNTKSIVGCQNKNPRNNFIEVVKSVSENLEIYIELFV